MRTLCLRGVFDPDPRKAMYYFDQIPEDVDVTSAIAKYFQLQDCFMFNVRLTEIVIHTLCWTLQGLSTKAMTLFEQLWVDSDSTRLADRYGSFRLVILEFAGTLRGRKVEKYGQNLKIC